MFISASLSSQTSDEFKRKQTGKKTNGPSGDFAYTDIRYREAPLPNHSNRMNTSPMENRQVSLFPHNINRFMNGPFIAVNVCYLTNPNRFFVHAVADEYKIPHIERNIEVQLKTAKKITHAIPGSYSVTIFPKSKQVMKLVAIGQITISR